MILIPASTVKRKSPATTSVCPRAIFGPHRSDERPLWSGASSDGARTDSLTGPIFVPAWNSRSATGTLHPTSIHHAIQYAISYQQNDLMIWNPKTRCFAAIVLIVALMGLSAGSATAQVFGMDEGQGLVGEGWSGFTDIPFLLKTLLTLIVATVLGAAIAYHPRTRLVIDTVEEAEAPKTFIIYAVVGAVIGLLVLKYGLIVGFVVFGIGGLIRFRTTLPTATKTGRLIFVTLIGLSAGLDLPHVAVLSTAFLFGLIYVLEKEITYSIQIQGLDGTDVLESWKAYRSVLEGMGCSILSEKRNLSKGKVTLVFRTSPSTSREKIDQAFGSEIPTALEGTVDWEVE